MLSRCPACRTPCDQRERHVGSPVVEKAPLQPASTRLGYQTFRCAYMHRRGPSAGPVTPRKSPPSPACRSTTTLYTCCVTAKLLTGRTDNVDTCHNLVPERSNYPEALIRARRRLLTAEPNPTRANTPTLGILTDDQLCVPAASDWAPQHMTALDANTLATADTITPALLAESVRETLERRLDT